MNRHSCIFMVSVSLVPRSSANSTRHGRGRDGATTSISQFYTRVHSGGEGGTKPPSAPFPLSPVVVVPVNREARGWRSRRLLGPTVSSSTSIPWHRFREVWEGGSLVWANGPDILRSCPEGTVRRRVLSTPKTLK